MCGVYNETISTYKELLQLYYIHSRLDPVCHLIT